MSRPIPILVLALLLVAAAPVRAGDADEASLEILRETLQANKKALVDVNLELSDDEARAFWPVYDRYQKDLGAVQERMARLIATYTAEFGKVGNEQAEQLTRDYLAIELDRAKVRESYLGPISKVLPGRKVMRFYQIENKIDAVLRYELAKTIPVVEQ